MIDLEAKAYMFILGMKEEQEKEYTDFSETPLKSAYVFKNNEEFKEYFVNNGAVDVSDGVLDLCKMKTTTKGSIVAMKKLCDRTICSYVEPDKVMREQIEEVKVYQK